MAALVANMRDISIHALRGEGDTLRFEVSQLSNSISIHALRGEGDFVAESRYLKPPYFNPRPPWGGRQKVDIFK